MAAGNAGDAVAGEEAVIVAGFGCRRNVAIDALEAALHAALDACELSADVVDAIATSADKAREAAIGKLAVDRDLPLMIVSEDEMRAVAAGTLTHSDRVMALRACRRWRRPRRWRRRGGMRRCCVRASRLEASQHVRLRGGTADDERRDRGR